MYVLSEKFRVCKLINKLQKLPGVASVIEADYDHERCKDDLLTLHALQSAFSKRKLDDSGINQKRQVIYSLPEVSRLMPNSTGAKNLYLTPALRYPILLPRSLDSDHHRQVIIDDARYRVNKSISFFS